MNTTQMKTLFDALSIEDLAPEEQEDLLLELEELVFKGTMLRLVERMDDDTRDAFDALMAGDPSEEEVQAFLDTNVPGADQAVEETIAELTNDILAATGESQD
jgi:hypothetical protein